MVPLYTIHGQPGFEPDHVIFAEADHFHYYIVDPTVPEGHQGHVLWGIMEPTLAALMLRIPEHERRIFSEMIAHDRPRDSYFRHPHIGA